MRHIHTEKSKRNVIRQWSHTHMNKLFKILGKTVLENDSCVLSICYFKNKQKIYMILCSSIVWVITFLKFIYG